MTRTLFAALVVALSSQLAPAAEAPARKKLDGFLDKNCARCHGPTKKEGKLDLSALDGDIANGKDIERWKLIADKVAVADMPPDHVKRPPAVEAAWAVEFLKAELRRGAVDVSDVGRRLRLPGYGNRVDHAALFSGKITGPVASPARVWRLSPQIYTSMVPRISGVKSKKGGKKGGKGDKVAQPFSVSSAEGFKDYADLYAIDEPTVGQLMSNAGHVVEALLSPRGKFAKDFAPLLNESRKPSDAEVEKAVRRQFGLALMREPAADEVKRFTAFYRKAAADTGAGIAARTMLSSVLMLPEALYRIELGRTKPDRHGRRMLSPRELAFALAYALDDDGPDDALLKAAASGKLATADDVRREVKRLLAKEPVPPRVMRFFEEYFEYPTAIDVFKDFPRGQWRPEILVHDTAQLVRYIVARDRDVLKELLTTNKSFVNYKIGPKGSPEPARGRPKVKGGKGAFDVASLYNLPDDWEWTARQPVELPKGQRAGILTQPSWLAAFATNDETHAIRRGKWVRERLLGGCVPDLPISVDAQLPNAPHKTVRERMNVTRQTYCWQCHRKMNDLGLAFEQFDYVGRLRTSEKLTIPPPPVVEAPPMKGKKGKKPPKREPTVKLVPLDTTGLVAYAADDRLNGPVKNSVELMHHLAGSAHVRQVFVRHAFRFWMGRNEMLSDAPVLLAADRAYVESGGSMRALLLSLLSSDAFLYRK